MLPDFDLEELTNLYIQKMSPVVKFESLDMTTGRIEKVNVSILYWYIKFDENILSANTSAAKKYREELFGAAPLEETPELFSEYAFYKEHSITEDAFQQLDLQTRARMRAHHFLSGLVQLRETHLQKMKEKRERREQEARAKAEQKASK